jgi:hypothetical protein
MSAIGERRLWPFVIVGVLGVVAATVQFLADNRDPLVLSIPILVVTGVILLVMAIARGGTDDLAQIAADLGLRDDGVAALPAVTPILAGHGGATHVISGRLPGRGPRVRIARAGGRLVALSETTAEGLSAEAQAFADRHPLHPEAAIEEGILVVAVAPDTPGDALLEVTGGINERL